jgi:hypothetical protein
MYSQTESLTWQIDGVLHTAMSTETELQRQNERLELPLNRMGHENREMGTRYAKQLIENIPWGKEWAEKVGLGFKLPTLESSVGRLGLPKQQKSKLEKLA